MNSFDILQRPQLPIGSFCLDASAGTGKTFSIENFVARKLMESELRIEQFLIVTFTRAAAFELKHRILKSLAKVLQQTENELHQKKLKLAIANFDLATITTIHSFCFNALKEHGRTETSLLKIEESEIDSKIAYQAIADLFYTEEMSNLFTQKQLEVLLKAHGGSPLELAKQIVRHLERGLRIASVKTNPEILQTIEEKMRELKAQGWNREKFLGEFQKAAKHFKEVCNRAGEPKDEISTTFEKLALLFDEIEAANLDSITHLLTVRLKFSKENLKAKGDMPQKWLQVVDFLSSPIYEWVDSSFLMLRLLKLSEKYIRNQYEIKQSINFTELLLKVESLANNSSFQAPLRERYQMVIIDEFQDTDPVQWKIFQQIFLKADIPLMLVGDPKQSIYAFRSADIYTFLEAKNLIPESNRFSLDTNYRSSRELVEALNNLFSETKSPCWMTLPKTGSYLPYPTVHASKSSDHIFSDENPLVFLTHPDSMHVTLKEFERDYLFPFFTSELLRLKKDKQISFSEVAFLVRDHAQGHRLAMFLRKRGFPVSLQKPAQFSDMAIGTDFFYLLKAILQPRDLNTVLTALGTRFFKVSLADLAEIKRSGGFLQFLPLFIKLQQVYASTGLYGCVKAFLSSRVYGKDRTVGEILLSGPSGQQDYEDLFQLVTWLLKRGEISLEELFKELENAISTHHPFKEDLKPEVHRTQAGVRIMTLHMSKGLEFDVVFALGVINRQRADEDFMILRECSQSYLKPILKTENAYLSHLEECDAEKARQLYVALTRAKYKLYIPLLRNQKGARLGEASPLELFLAKRSGIQDWKTVYELMEDDKLNWMKAIQDFECCFLNHQVQEACYVLTKVEAASPVPFTKIFPVEYTTSFTQLANAYFVNQGAPKDYFIDKKNAHTLPAGSVTGELLHRLIEEVPIELVKAAHSPMDLYDFIAKYTSHSLYRNWEAVLAEILFKVFSTPFKSHQFRLNELEASDFFKEMEFAVSTQNLDFCKSEQKEMKGVIDFAFKRGQEVYLIDWKSHWLGESDEAYSLEAMRVVMQQHQYDLQARIYMHAFNHYLRRFPQLRLKGIFYFFLRGAQSIFLPFKDIPKQLQKLDFRLRQKSNF